MSAIKNRIFVVEVQDSVDLALMGETFIKVHRSATVNHAYCIVEMSTNIRDIKV